MLPISYVAGYSSDPFRPKGWTLLSCHTHSLHTSLNFFSSGIGAQEIWGRGPVLRCHWCQHWALHRSNICVVWEKNYEPSAAQSHLSFALNSLEKFKGTVCKNKYAHLGSRDGCHFFMKCREVGHCWLGWHFTSAHSRVSYVNLISCTRHGRHILHWKWIECGRWKVKSVANKYFMVFEANSNYRARNLKNCAQEYWTPECFNTSEKCCTEFHCYLMRRRNFPFCMFIIVYDARRMITGCDPPRRRKPDRYKRTT